jgi:hypothetical protein
LAIFIIMQLLVEFCQRAMQAIDKGGSLVLSGVRDHTRPEHVAENDRSWYIQIRVA